MDAMRSCAHCRGPLTAPRATDLADLLARFGFAPSSDTRRFCSTACRKRAYRRRRAGLAEDAYREGARRGRVGLDRLTAAEQRHEWELIAAELRATAQEART
jgi:hypothetical protein